LRFRWTEGEPAYSALANIAAVNPPDLAADRRHGGLGGPRQETLTFFPGHRQVLPWPDPFYYRVVRRVELAKPYGGHAAGALPGRNVDRAYTSGSEIADTPPVSLCGLYERPGPVLVFCPDLDGDRAPAHERLHARQFELART